MPDQPTEQPERAHVWPIGLRAAHWLLAIAIAAATGLALYLLNPPIWSDEYVGRYAAGIEIHKLIGLAAFAAALALAAQHKLRPPRTGSALEQQLAARVQGALVTLALSVPVAGYIADGFHGGVIAIPGLPALPSPLARSDQLSSIMTVAHDIGAYVLLALIAVHVLAALRRQILHKQPIISAMLRTGDKSKDQL